MSHSHPWYNLVVGGVDKPLLLTVGENLCTNPRFSLNTSGWTTGNQCELVRISNAQSFGEYVGQLSYLDSGLFSADYQINIIPQAGNQYLVSFRIWNNSVDQHNVMVVLNVGGINLSVYYIVTNANKPIKVSFVTPVLRPDHTYIKLQIYGTDVMKASSVKILFDDVYICKVADYCLLSYPNDGTHLLMEKDVQGENNLWDGKIQEYNKKWRPHWYASWKYLSRSDELKRILIANASQVFVFPHSDFMWGFFGIWDKDIDHKYSFDRYFGHESDIAIKGTEWMYEGIPKDVEFIPSIGIVTISISSLGVSSGVHIYIDNPDINDNADGVTEFTRMYESAKKVRMIAPESVTINGELRLFIQWEDASGNVLSTNRDITVTISALEIRYVAKYQDKAEVIGYGSLYGGDVTNGYGIVL